MNTADPIIDSTTNTPYSVRYQGAGMVDVYGAVNNKVTATINGESKVLLGEFTSNKTVEIVLKNYGKEVATYTLGEAKLYTDYIENGVDKKLKDNKYGIKPINGAKVYFEQKSVTVPTGGETVVKANVTIPKNTENNTYIEGYISFKGQGIENIGMPVLGFYGDYGDEKIIDESIYYVVRHFPCSYFSQNI